MQGGVHVCAIKAGRLQCWGSNAGGQLGCGARCADLPVMEDAQGSIAYSGVPVDVAGGLRWSRVAPSIYFTCGVTAEGAALCW